MYTVTLYVAAAAGLIISFQASKEKTRRALTISGKSLLNMLRPMLTLVGIIGIIMVFLPPEWIAAHLGEEAGPIGTLLAALVGAITLIPGFVAYPLAGSIYRAGASVMTVAAFITTLTMVGFVTAPVESRQLGRRFTLWRNGLSFLSALVIAYVMGVLLS
jgi:uncharacterized membrane protein YraQ (UPF0718 family)